MSFTSSKAPSEAQPQRLGPRPVAASAISSRISVYKSRWPATSKAIPSVVRLRNDPAIPCVTFNSAKVVSISPTALSGSALAVCGESRGVPSIRPGCTIRRWEIETTFAELKVTQGMAGSFRSRTTEGIAFEVAGHLLLYTLIRLLMAEAAARSGTGRCG